MFGLTATTTDLTDRVKKAAEKAQFKNFGHAAASIRKTAVASIIKAEGPSPAGTPPHTRRNQLRRAIRYDATKEDAVIGPMESVVGLAGAAHEFGGDYKGTELPERSYMLPALLENIDRFASSWQGSITGG